MKTRLLNVPIDYSHVLLLVNPARAYCSVGPKEMMQDLARSIGRIEAG